MKEMYLSIGERRVVVAAAKIVVVLVILYIYNTLIM